MFEERWYQREAVDNTIANLKTKPGNPIIAMPTGTGKSIVIAQIIRELHSQFPSLRIAMLTHSKELISQNADRLRGVYNTNALGIYSAGLKLREAEMPIIFASIQSVAAQIRKNGNIFGQRHLVIVDEAHMISNKEESSYQLVFNAWRKEFPTLKIVGLSATPYRHKGGLIYGADDSLFDYVAYDLCTLSNFNRLVAEGYIAPLIAVKPCTEINLSSVAITGGDYNQKALQKTIGSEGLLENAVAEIVAAGFNRRNWLTFTSGIENAEKVTDLFKMHGIVTACVHSKQSAKLNDAIIADFKNGHIQSLVNADMLTTGFDCPEIELIGMLRPTISVALWVQMLGRGTRPATNKTDTLVLDFAGNTGRLGPINDPIIPKRPGAPTGGPAPAKICPNCFAYNHTLAVSCLMCGHIFPTIEKLSANASELPVMVSNKDVENEEVVNFKIRHVLYKSHVKTKGGPASLVVEYQFDTMSVVSYIPWEHGGKAKFVADKWWKTRFDTPRPLFAEDLIEAIKNGLAIPLPKSVDVIINSMYNKRIKPKIKKEVWS